MIRNYVNIALRSMVKHRLYTLINVLSLSVGIGCTALILLYVQDELTFDQFHEKKDRIFRISRIAYEEDGSIRDTDTNQPMPFGAAIQADLPEVIRYARLFPGRSYLRYGEKVFQENVLFADPSLLDMFTFPLASGHKPMRPEEVVISQEIASKYFGDMPAVGQSISCWMEDQYRELVIVAVSNNIPKNSSVNFDILIPFQQLTTHFSFAREDVNDWESSSSITYVELAPQASAVAFQGKMAGLRTKYFPTEAETLRELDRWNGAGLPYSYLAQQLPDIHLNPTISSGLTPPSNPTYSYILATIALCLLLIACINFMTLAIGRSASRIKEIGIRKVIGASRMQLIIQFGAEAILISLVALVLGIALAEVLLPVFSELAEKELHTVHLLSPIFLSSMLAVALIAGLLAGSYPALVLSRFKPVEAFRNNHKLGGKNFFTRSLIVVQFSLAILLMVSALTMGNQIRFMKSKYLGFDKEHIIAISTGQVDGDQLLERYRQLATTHPGIESVGASTIAFARNRARVGFEYENQIYEPDFFRVDHNYLPTLGLELIEGRNFDPKLPTDTLESILINESMVKLLRWENPVGKRLTGFRRRRSGMDSPVIIGVVKDFNFRSLENPVDAGILSMETSRDYRYVLVRLSPNQVQEAITSLESTWQESETGLPFSYSFLDEDMNRFYQADERWGEIVGYASGLTLLLAGLGLFGLSALAAAGRSKEVGIRKVLGASISHIFILLSRGLGKLVLIAFILAAPISWFLMNNWLSQFAYRITLGPDLYLGAAILLFGILLLTVSYNALRAAWENPVNALRDD